MSQMVGPNSPAWLCRLILEGVQRMLGLRLPGSPAADMVQTTANLWIEAITNLNRVWIEERDTDRIRKAFRTLAATMDRWPAPKHFLEALPPTNENPTLALPQPHSRSVPPDIRKWLNDFSSRGKRIAEGN